MLTNDQIAHFHHDGFLRGHRILRDDQVDELRDELARVIRDQHRSDLPQPVVCRNLSPDADHPVWQIVNIWQASEPFRRLVNNPTIVEQAAQLTSASELRLFHDQIQYKPAGTGGVNMWHQDSPYWPILMPRTAQVTAWVALDDVNEENGCMSMVRGSHRWGDQIAFLHTLRNFDDLPHEFQNHPIQVRRCPVPPGHVHYHHSLTWHGSHANTSVRPRRAVALHYMSEQTRYNSSGDHVMKPLVAVEHGQVLCGSAFPVVWSRRGSDRR